MPDGLWQVVQGYAIHFPGTVAVAVPGQLSTTMTNWPISMRCLADDLIGLGIKSSASPINEDLTLASEVQISRYEMLGCVFFKHHGFGFDVEPLGSKRARTDIQRSPAP